jgi:hypothetical protein
MFRGTAIGKLFSASHAAGEKLSPSIIETWMFGANILNTE